MICPWMRRKEILKSARWLDKALRGCSEDELRVLLRWDGPDRDWPAG